MNFKQTLLIICIIFASAGFISTGIMMNNHGKEDKKPKLIEIKIPIIELIKPIVKRIDTSEIMYKPVMYLVEIQGNKYIVSMLVGGGYQIVPVNK